MRGKQQGHPAKRCASGNIPAYAGKTESNANANRMFQEHPRVCGENLQLHMAGNIAMGTSPRMRGKHLFMAGVDIDARNIPAYAGKTGCMTYARILCGEHPRVCGENCRTWGGLAYVSGTSPRMRGKLLYMRGE